jgi:hypothetical protein
MGESGNVSATDKFRQVFQVDRKKTKIKDRLDEVSKKAQPIISLSFIF